MPANTNEWKTELAQLSISERAELAWFLIDSLDGVEDSDVDKAWEKELAHRAQQIKSGFAQGEPAETAMNELREKHS